MAMQADDTVKRSLDGFRTAQSLRSDIVVVPDGPIWFLQIDWVFTIAFSIECFCRLVVYELRFFVGEDCCWNWLDAVVVFFSWVEVAGIASGSSEGGSSGMPPLRLFRLIRVVRSLRVIRSLRFFTELRLVLLSLVHSLKPLLWSTLTLLLIAFMFANMFLQLLSEALASSSFDTEQDPEWAQQLLPMFSSFGDAMISLLALIIGGMEWYDPYKAFSDMSILAASVLLFYVVVIVLGVLNVIAAVFVEAAISKAKTDHHLSLAEEHEVHKEMADELIRVFHAIDTDSSGVMTLQEWLTFISTEAGQQFRILYDVDSQQAADLFKVLDIDDSGAILIEEFVVGFMKVNGAVSKFDMEIESRNRTKLTKQLKEQNREISSRLAKIESRLHHGLGM